MVGSGASNVDWYETVVRSDSGPDDVTLVCAQYCKVVVGSALGYNGAVNWVLAARWELLCNVADGSEVCNVAVGRLTILGSATGKWSLGKEVAAGFCRSRSIGSHRRWAHLRLRHHRCLSPPSTTAAVARFQRSPTSTLCSLLPWKKKKETGEEDNCREGRSYFFGFSCWAPPRREENPAGLIHPSPESSPDAHPVTGEEVLLRCRPVAVWVLRQNRCSVAEQDS
ncbi:hypothetical protein MRB53_035426 [Persea americana]|uniref:Uncharacterized protein n=1 Tax=Persea americana TaxID=3435 RepID=A0ACC2K4M9_PERAE|nr:hypothetical protein MRB53_035426 [Persea americana]